MTDDGDTATVDNTERFDIDDGVDFDGVCVGVGGFDPEMNDKVVVVVVAIDTGKEEPQHHNSMTMSSPTDNVLSCSMSCLSFTSKFG